MSMVGAVGAYHDSKDLFLKQHYLPSRIKEINTTAEREKKQPVNN
jgi:hypothetical protein